MVKWWEAVSAKGQLLCFYASGLQVPSCKFRAAGKFTGENKEEFKLAGAVNKSRNQFDDCC